MVIKNSYVNNAMKKNTIRTSVSAETDERTQAKMIKLQVIAKNRDLHFSEEVYLESLCNLLVLSRTLELISFMIF